MPKARQFTDLKELEEYVRFKVESALRDSSVENIFKNAMVEAIDEAVYEAYDPQVYKRRTKYGMSGGLDDTNNMMFLTVSRKDGGRTITNTFENLAVGSDQPVYGYPTDSMNGFFIADLIEEGSDNIHNSPSNYQNGWYRLGEWSEPRPFQKLTAQILNGKSYYNTQLKVFLEKSINS